MYEHTKQSAVWLAVGFGFTILAISGLTTGGFFYTYFEIVPPGLIDAALSALISAFIGFLLLDGACTIWLYTYLYASGTKQQRSIAIIMASLTFVGAAAASAAYLGLSAASADIAMAGDTRETMSNLALAVVIFAVVANFGASLVYNRYSAENKIQVRESARMDKLQGAEDKQADLLDDLIASNVEAEISALAPVLAREQAGRLVADFRAREAAKYAPIGTMGAIADGRQGQPIGYTPPKRNEATGGGSFYQRRARLASPSPQTNGVLAVENGQFQLSTVGSDGLGYAQEIDVLPEVGAAWADFNRRGVIPQGMSYSTFRRLHQDDQASRAQYGSNFTAYTPEEYEEKFGQGSGAANFTQRPTGRQDQG